MLTSGTFTDGFLRPLSSQSRPPCFLHTSLDDVCAKLKITVTVSMSNTCPNIALSVRKIMHPDDTKADLRFLLPNGATTAAEVPVTLAYFNQRIETEDACDRLQAWAADVGIEKSAIAFYHEKSAWPACGNWNAMGMGCDMRNIRRVILWKLPPSFCALAQRSGRAGCDFEALGEPILFVSAKALKDGVAEEQARITREEAADLQNQEGDVFVPEPQEGLDVVAGQEVVVGEGGVRVERDAEEDDAEVTPEVQTKKRKEKQHRIVWDEYFDNAKEEGARCCDNCEPTQFPVELVVVEKIPGLKGGKKRKWPTELSNTIWVGLRKWSREALMPLLYPKDAGFSMTGSALLPDSTIEQIAMCGERVNSVENLQRRARWFLMPNHGAILLQALQQIFDQYDSEDPDESDPPQDIMDMILMERGHGRGRAQGRRRGRGSTGPGATAARGAVTRGRPRGRPRGGRRAHG
ncbi:hypothetical protein B0H14DRAFT_3878104 [Mycena olivaceomarginata]|nr:hypothetical protein B0H14DRAFT_3878104 [Mycena olivaceomarginata]